MIAKPYSALIEIIRSTLKQVEKDALDPSGPELPELQRSGAA